MATNLPSKDFLTPLIQHALAMKEIFDAYVGAGFTSEQALWLIAQRIDK